MESYCIQVNIYECVYTFRPFHVTHHSTTAQHKHHFDVNTKNIADREIWQIGNVALGRKYTANTQKNIERPRLFGKMCLWHIFHFDEMAAKCTI